MRFLVNLNQSTFQTIYVPVFQRMQSQSSPLSEFSLYSSCRCTLPSSFDTDLLSFDGSVRKEKEQVSKRKEEKRRFAGQFFLLSLSLSLSLFLSTLSLFRKLSYFSSLIFSFIVCFFCLFSAF